MINSKSKKKLLALGLAVVTVILPLSSAIAAVQSLTSSAEFIAPVALSAPVNLRFGLIDEAFTTGETIIIAPDGTETGTATSRFAGGTRGAGSVTVTATASQTLTIVVDNIGSPTGYAIDTWLCAYNAGSATACDGGGMTATSIASASLTIGATMTGNGSAAVGADNVTFDITVLYQ